jgi:methionyl-tRNA formyltransferase
MGKTILVIGNDKIGRKAIHTLKEQDLLDDIDVFLDSSSNAKRVFRLIKKNALKLSWVLDMALANFLRKDFPKPNYIEIKNNNELLKYVNHKTSVIMFRAGLIINKTVIKSSEKILNIHCAKVPQYGGLGSIKRALNDRALAQCATLHHVVEKIDSGEVLSTEEYTLNPNESYFSNEERAYSAGIKLLSKYLRSIKNVI